ncbi:MAG: hypothetical protein LUE98_14090 [Tannerellaceae bacterium]|nr:hypothetical protein [Tannerellaceae bacterium]
MKENIPYTLADLLENEYFIHSVLHPAKESESYWHEMQEKNLSIPTIMNWPVTISGIWAKPTSHSQKMKWRICGQPSTCKTVKKKKTTTENIFYYSCRP